MNLTVFLELVEFKAKTASVLPFFIGICFSLYNFHKLHLGLVLLYFIAMFIFNMAVDILDNYNDYHHATEIHDYREKTNINYQYDNNILIRIKLSHVGTSERYNIEQILTLNEGIKKLGRLILENFSISHKQKKKQ